MNDQIFAPRIVQNGHGAADIVPRLHEEEDAGASVFLPPDALARIRNKDDPDRMKLTEEEHNNALRIKERVEGIPELDNLTDLMYGQLAIVCKDNVEDAEQRCWAMQYFRHEYLIEDRYNQGCQMMDIVFGLFPEQFLFFGFSESDGTYVWVHDLSKFEPRAFTRPKLSDDYYRFQYYSHILFCPDFESIRKGIITVCECRDVNMRRDVTKHVSKFFSEFLSHYPFNGQCRFFNTGTMVNIFASVLRKLLPKELRETFQVGYQMDGHLSEAFLVPNVEESNKRMLTNLKETLKLRYDDEKSFSLRS